MHTIEQLNTALADRYRLDEEIGRGGMATVYRAYDLRHDRPVAIKVLNPELGAVVGSARFLQEIRLTANLRHPNLLPLFDSGEANGLLFYVMPLVDGESLRARLAREQQLPVDEAVHIGTSVASALDYAHSRDVVHRDLKPENILLQSGEPLIADFGIALAVTRAGGERATQSGVSIGTPQYMSPEQAMGERNVDGRSDVYSLSAVLYEMLTGEPPHRGNTLQFVIARVLTEPVPSVRLVRPNVPEHVAAAISKGLEKLPADRWQTAREFAEALTGRRQVPSLDAPRPFPRRRRLLSWRNAAILAAGFALGAIAVGIAAFRSLRAPRAQSAVLDLALPDNAAPRTGLPGRNIAISRDGSTIAYIGAETGGATRAIFDRRLTEISPRLLGGTDSGDCVGFSPNGASIVFRSHGRLWRTGSDGGAPAMLGDSVAGSCALWTDRNELLYRSRGALVRMPADGGPRATVARVDSLERLFLSQVLPDGKTALIHYARVGDELRIGLLSLSTGRITGLPVTGAQPEYADGYLLFQSAATRIAVIPFSPRTGKITGPAVTLLDGVTGDFDVSPSGSLAYLYFADAVSQLGGLGLVAVAANGGVRALGGASGGAKLSAVASAIDTAFYSWPRLSPDGERVALEMRTEPSSGTRATFTYDIWVYDLRSRTLSRLTSGWTGFRPAGWTPDGRSIVYMTFDSRQKDYVGSRFAARNPRVVSQVWDGSEPPRELMRLNGDVFDVTVGPPHTYLAYTTAVGDQLDIWVAPLDSANRARPIAATPSSEEQPRISPDGRLLAYTSYETGRHEVYVRPLAGPGQRLQVSASGGMQPIWSQDGRRLYYRGVRYMMRATIDRGSVLRLVRVDTLFRDVYEQRDVANYDVFPGGHELLMIRRNAGTVRAAVILNWREFLRGRTRQ